MSNRRKQKRRTSATQSGEREPSEERSHSTRESTDIHAGVVNATDKISVDHHPVVVVLNLIGIGVFAALAGLFGATTHVVLSIWCVWVVVFSALFMAERLVGNSKPMWKRKLRAVCICVLIGVSVWFSFWSYEILHIVKSASEVWRPPELPPQSTNIHLLFGGNFTEMSRDEIKTSHYLSLNGFEPIKWRIEANRFYVDVDIPFGDKIIKVRGGQFSAEMPPEWDMNFTASALEIVTASNNPIYQVIYRRPDEVIVSGIFAKSSSMVVSTTNGLEMWNGASNVASHLNAFYTGKTSTGLKAIFKYPSFKHRGEYAE